MATQTFSIKLTANGKEVKALQEELIKLANKYEQELEGINKQLKERKDLTEEERKELEKQSDSLTAKIKALNTAVEENITNMRKIGDVMRNLAGSSGGELGKALRGLGQQFKSVSDQTLKQGETLEQKLTEIKEKMMEVRHEMAKREGVDAMKRAKATLTELANTPLDKLKMGLDSIEKKLSTMSEAEKQAADGMTLLQGRAQYKAQIAVNEYGRAGSAPMEGMTDDQLRAEQSRLRSLYMSTQGATGFEGISKDALTRLQQANKLIKDRADAEREAAKAARESELAEQRRLQFAQQGQETHKTLANMEKASYEDLENALKHLEEQRRKYIQAGDTKHIQRNLQMQDKLKQKQVEMQKLMLTDAQIKDRVQNKEKYNVIELQQAYDQLKYKLTTLHTGEQQQIKETRKQMKSLEKDIKGVQGEVTGLQKIWQTAVRNIATYMGVFAIAGFAKNKIQSLVKDNLALSDSMAQVQKVTGLTSEEVKKLNVNLAKLDTRTGIEQLNELAYSAGKMGLGKYGVEGIQQFVNAANQLQVALGDDLGASVDEAITPLAKLAENLGLFEKMGVEKAMTAIGSSINELSQTTTAAGRNIVDFARRIQPAAQMIGLTTDEILALGSASDSFGVSSEISATAFTKFLAAYRTNTAEIEKILSMVPGTLDKFFDDGKTMEGLLAIFQRMHEIGDLRYLEDAFKALGSEGSRMFTTFGAFAKNVDMFREHLATSTKAFDEATSVTREYNLVQETAQGIIERSNNIWKNAFVNPDGVDMVKQLADEWYRLSRELTESTTWMTAAKNSLGLILEAVKLLIEVLPTLIRLMMAYGVGAALQGIAKNFWDIYRAVTITNSGVAKFNALLKTNAFAIAVMLLGYVVTKFIDMASAADTATDSVNENNAALERSQRAAQTYTSTMASNYASLMEKYDKLKREWKSLKSEHEKNEWIRKNKQAFDELGLSITGAASAEEVFEKNTARVVEGFKRRAEAAALAAKMTELYRQKMDVENEAQQLVNEKGKEAGDRVYKQPAVMQRDKNSNTFNNGQFILGRDGIYYYTAQGAEQYNRELLKQKQSEYDNIDKQIEDAAKRMEELGKTPMNNATTPTKGNGKGNAELKNKFKTAKEKADGLIAKIDQWYNLQDATINEFVTTGQITEEEAKKALEAMKIARNVALQKARLAVASGDDTEWKKFYEESMSKMMIDHGEWSGLLFEEITKVDIKALHDFLSTFDGSETMARLDASSFFDAMRKKAAESKKVVSETQAKAREELNKMLLKYEYFDKAARQFASNLIQIGALGTTAEQMAQGMEGAPTAEQSIEAVKSLLAAMLRQGNNLFKVNPSNAKGVAEMIRNTATSVMTEEDYLTGKNSSEEAHWFDLFPEVKDWMENPDQHKKELENFYKVMLQAEQDYYQKRKQSYDHEKQEHDNRFRAAGYTEQESKEQSSLSTLAALKDAGIGATFMEQQGLGSIAEDPEVMAIQNRIAWRQKDVADAEARITALRNQQQQELSDLQTKQDEELALKEAAGASMEELEKLRMEHRQQMIDMEAQQNVERMGAEDLLKEYQANLFDQETQLATKVAQELQKRIQTINSLTQPIQKFAGNVGQKFGEMMRGMKEDSMTWSDIFKEMELAVAESMLNIAGQYVQNLIIQKATNKAAEAEEGAHATTMTMFGISAGAAKTIGLLGWLGIALVPVITSLLMGLLKGALSSQRGGDESAASASSVTPKTKLVSGMLTYDRGNVDRFAGRRKLYDDGTTQVYGPKRYIGQDGKVYTATEEPAPKSGLVKHPIATTVEGQPALVAEKGPEIVIGRETTANIMRNAPELLQAIVDIDKNPHKKPDALPTYDKGNVSEVAGEAKAAENSEKVQEVTMRVNRDNRYHTKRQDERNNEEQSVAMSEESLQRMMEQFRKTRISHEATNKHRRQQEDSRKESMRRDSVTTDAKDSTESLTRWFRDFATAEMTTQYVTLGEWAKAPESHIGEIKQLYKVLSSHDEQTRRSDQQAIERTMDTINNVKDITSVKAESENTVVSEEALSKMTAKFRTIEEQRRLDTNDTAAVTRWLNDFVTTTDTSAISRQTSDIKNREVREQFVKSMPAVEQWQTEPEKHVSEILQLYNTLATHDEQMRRSEQEHAERSIATVNDVMSIIGMKTDATSTDRQQSVKITEDIATEMVRKHRQVEEQRRQREEQEQKRVKDATSWLRDFVTTDVTSLEDVKSQKEDVTKKLDVSSKKSDVQDTSTVSHQTSDIKNSEVRESFTKAMPHVDEWLKEPEKHVEEIMQLRSMLTRYDEQLQRSEVGNSEHNEVDSKQRIARSISDNIDRNETAAFSDEVLNQMVSKHRSINEQRRLREEQEQKRSSVDERSRSDVQDVRRTFDKGNVEEVTKRRRLDTSNTEEMTRWLNDFVTTDVTSLEDVRSQKEDVTKKLDVSSKKSDVQDTSTVSRQTSDIKNSEVRESFTKAMPHVDEWLQEPEKHQQEIAKLYTTLTDIDERERISREESSRMDDRRTDSATVRRDSVTTDKNIALTEQYYKGEDGRTYKAQPGAVPEGVTLLTKPIATMINGEPSLVAEKGPELVIGRETTKAMQLNRPDLLRAIVSFDKNKTQQSMRMFDQGNIQSIGADTSETPVSDANEERQALRQQMTQMQDVMNGVLYYLQHPVRPKIDMYSHGGEDGLYDSMKKATKFMSRYGG